MGGLTYRALIVGMGMLSGTIGCTPAPREPRVIERIVEGDGVRFRYPQRAHATVGMPNGPRRIDSLLDIRTPLRFGGYVWNDDGIAPGRTWVRVDLRNQTMSVFRGGDEIGSAVVLYGTDGKKTPLGTFRVLARDRDHVSTLYDAPMPYMLRLTTDGVAIHQSSVERGSATHGCIGIPAEFARRLFDVMRVGDEVAILAA